MPNSYPEWSNFQFDPHNHYRFFFLRTLLSTVAFRLDYVLFYQFYAKTTTFFFLSRNVPFCSSVIRLTSCYTKFPSPGRVYGNSGQVCKKLIYSTFYQIAQNIFCVCLLLIGICVVRLFGSVWRLHAVSNCFLYKMTMVTVIIKPG